MSPRKSSSGKSNVQPISPNDSGTSLKLCTPYGRTDTSQWMPDLHGKKCMCDSCWGIPRKERKKKVLEEDADILIVSKRERNQKRLNYDAADEDVQDGSSMDSPDMDGCSPTHPSRSGVESPRRTSPRLNGKRKRFSIESDEEEVPSKKKVRSPRLQQKSEMETQNKKGSSPHRTNDVKPQEQNNEEQRVHQLIGTMTDFMQYVENEISKEPEEEQKKDMQRYVVKMKQLMTAAHNLARQC